MKTRDIILVIALVLVVIIFTKSYKADKNESVFYKSILQTETGEVAQSDKNVEISDNINIEQVEVVNATEDKPEKKEVVVSSVKTEILPVATKTVVSNSNDHEFELRVVSFAKEFLIAIRDKNSTKAMPFISDKAKGIMDKIYVVSNNASQTELLNQDIVTIVGVVSARVLADKSTIGISGREFLSLSIEKGTYSEKLLDVDFDKLEFLVKNINDNVFDVEITIGDKQVSHLVIVNENSVLKVDYNPVLSNIGEKFENKVAEIMEDSGRTREETIVFILSVLFGGLDERSKYFSGVPLSDRWDLDPSRVKLQSNSDPLNGYAIDFPKDWKIDIVYPTSFFLAPYSVDGLRASISVTPNTTPNTQNLDEYAEEHYQLLPTIKPDITGPIVKTKVTFQGQPAVNLTYNRLRTFDEGKTYSKQTVSSILFFRNGYVYLVEYRNGLTDFENLKPLADKLINTIRFKELCTSSCSTF